MKENVNTVEEYRQVKARGKRIEHPLYRICRTRLCNETCEKDTPQGCSIAELGLAVERRNRRDNVETALTVISAVLGIVSIVRWVYKKRRPKTAS